jgi:hypothetical protein
MTLAWAIITVAVLYLIDKHHLWKKALITAGVLASLYALGLAGLFAYEWLQPKWEAHLWATHHDCFNPSTGEIHAVNSQPKPCQWDEQVHDRDTPQPIVSECDRNAGKPPLFEVDVPNGTKRFWQDRRWCKPTKLGSNGEEKTSKNSLPVFWQDGQWLRPPEPLRFDEPIPSGEVSIPPGALIGVPELSDSRFPQYSDLPAGAQVVSIPPKVTLDFSTAQPIDVSTDHGLDKVVNMTGTVLDVFEYSDADLKSHSLKCDQSSSCWYYVSFQPKGWTDWSLSWYGEKPTLSNGDCAVMKVRIANGKWMSPAQDKEHLPKLLSYQALSNQTCKVAAMQRW